MADKLKDLPDFYKNVNTSTLKKAWIKILILTALVGVIFVNLIPLPVFITIPLAVGIGIFFMILFGVTHPPAGGNPIIVIVGSASFSYIINPIIIGTIIVLIFGIILNRLILNKEYPKKHNSI